MLFLYTGTDRSKARLEVNTAAKKTAKKGSLFRVTDASSVEDLRAALRGSGMFEESRVVILDGIFANEEMSALALASLQLMKEAPDTFYILEEKLDAARKKQVEKYAEDSKRFDAPKKAEQKTIFILANALRRGDKKTLWVGYQREHQDSAPEAIHGVLFWGAKQMLLSAGSVEEKTRAKKLVAQLAQLPHEARRGGFELEYALERFVLANV